MNPCSKQDVQVSSVFQDKLAIPSGKVSFKTLPSQDIVALKDGENEIIIDPSRLANHCDLNDCIECIDYHMSFENRATGVIHGENYLEGAKLDSQTITLGEIKNRHVAHVQLIFASHSVGPNPKIPNPELRQTELSTFQTLGS